RIVALLEWGRGGFLSDGGAGPQTRPGAPAVLRGPRAGPGERAHCGTLSQGRLVDPGPGGAASFGNGDSEGRGGTASAGGGAIRGGGVGSLGGRMYKKCSRREWLLGTAAALPAAWLAGSRLGRAAAAPALPVAGARGKTYDPAELVATLSRMFDQLGGLGRLVNGKTVGIKINLTGDPTYRLGYAPLGDSHYTHPQGASVGGERQGGHRVRQPPGGRLAAARL